MWEQWWQQWRERRETGEHVRSLPDPELMLARVQQEMRDLHAKNRKRAVETITQKNNLQQMVDDLQKRVDNLQGKAELALKRGDNEIAEELRREAAGYEISLESVRQSLESAIETSEAVKTAIKRQEEQIRQKAAEALALKAQWRLSTIEQSLIRALTEDSVVAKERRLSRAQLHAHLNINRKRAEAAEKNRDDLAGFVAQKADQVEHVQQQLRAAQEQRDEAAEMHLLRLLEQAEAALANSREAWERATALAERIRSLVDIEAEWLSRQEDFFETFAPWQNADAPLLTPNEDADNDLAEFRWLLVGILVLIIVVAVALWLLK